MSFDHELISSWLQAPGSKSVLEAITGSFLKDGTCLISPDAPTRPGGGSRNSVKIGGNTHQEGRVLGTYMPVSRVLRVYTGRHQAWPEFASLPPCPGLSVSVSLSVLICKTS